MSRPEARLWLPERARLFPEPFFGSEKTRRIGGLEETTAPKCHPNPADWLNNLGNELERRFQRKGRMEDFEELIRRALWVANITPQGHPDLAD